MSTEEDNFPSFQNETDWWDIFVKEQYPNDKCLKYLKCSRKTYMFLVKALKPHIAPRIGSVADEDSSLYLRKGICVEKQVAIVLFKLTTRADYVTISKKFKIHKTTIHKIIYKSIIAINKHLLHSNISMPKTEEAEIITKDFEGAHKIPQLVGAMAIIHIPISSPINLNYKFLNSKLYPSFILQTVIDSNCLFRDVSVRHAGAIDPRLVLEDSNIYKFSQKVMPSEKQVVNGVEVSYKIVGPPSGPLYSWLLADYNPAPSGSEELFNECLEGVRNYADSVIARLRSRFLILSQMMDLSYKVAPQIIAACCIIHNLCEKEGDPFLEEWLMEYMELTKKYPQPEMKEEWTLPDDEVFRERDALRDHVTLQTEIESAMV